MFEKCKKCCIFYCIVSALHFSDIHYMCKASAAPTVAVSSRHASSHLSWHVPWPRHPVPSVYHCMPRHESPYATEQITVCCGQKHRMPSPPACVGLNCSLKYAFCMQ